MLFLMNKNQREKILDEYYSSLINIFSFSLFVLLIIFTIFLFPTYLTMRVDKKIMTQKVETLQGEIDMYKNGTKTGETLKIDNDIALLSASTTDRTLTMYSDIKKIYQEIPNVKLTSISIDILNKKIMVSATMDNKNTASMLVDRLNNSNYKGAELPYSVFSQNKNFILNQNLTYE